VLSTLWVVGACFLTHSTTCFFVSVRVVCTHRLLALFQSLDECKEPLFHIQHFPDSLCAPAPSPAALVGPHNRADDGDNTTTTTTSSSSSSSSNNNRNNTNSTNNARGDAEARGFRIHPSSFIMNTMCAGCGQVDENAFVEHCVLDSDCHIASGAVCSSVRGLPPSSSGFRLVVPSDVCVQQVAVPQHGAHDAESVLTIHGVLDGIKDQVPVRPPTAGSGGPTFAGKPWSVYASCIGPDFFDLAWPRSSGVTQRTLWNAKLFPRVNLGASTASEIEGWKLATMLLDVCCVARHCFSPHSARVTMWRTCRWSEPRRN